MYTIGYRINVIKIILMTAIIIVYVAGIYYMLGFYFTHRALITFIIACLTIILIIRAIGIFVMYPGSYRFISAQVQLNQNQHLLKSIHRDMKTIQNISRKIIKSDILSLKISNREHQFFSPHTFSCISCQLNILQKDDGNKSHNKIKLIQTYQQLIRQLTQEVQLSNEQQYEQQMMNSDRQCQNEQLTKTNQQINSISLQKILENPGLLKKLTSQKSLSRLKTNSQNSIVLCSRIWQLCDLICKVKTKFSQQYKFESTVSKSSDNNSNRENHFGQRLIINIDKFDFAAWHLFSQKLFCMNSYFGYWDGVLQYQTFLIPVDNHDFIQCALIYGDKPACHQKKSNSAMQESKNINDTLSQAKNGVGALFCNPNGAFIQALGLTSSYINFYLKWGIKVILWNYRGYGKSTGIPSVLKCLSDVQKVYNYTKIKYKIDIQVLHGYSIGGLPAIHLANKLNIQPNKPIKLLIADRTFSCFDKVAQGFIKKRNLFARVLRRIAGPFVNLFFHSDCIDNSLKFIESKCNKLCIYDTIDEIISRQASLKQGIVSQIKKGKQAIEDPENSQSQRLIQQPFINTNVKDQAQQFAINMYKLYKKDIKLFEKILKFFQNMDGAGQTIYSSSSKTKRNQTKSTKMSRQQMKQKYCSYFINLCIHGPKLFLPFCPTDSFFQNYMQTLLQQKIKLIKQCMDSNENSNINQVVNRIIRNIQYLRAQMKIDQIAKNRKKYGQMVVTSIGHNSQLKRQFYFLEKALHQYVLKGIKKENNLENKN